MRTNLNYSPSSLEKALVELEKGTSSERKISELYGIPRTMLKRKDSGPIAANMGAKQFLHLKMKKNYVKVYFCVPNDKSRY